MSKSRGELSTKIHAAVDELGNPVRLILTAGQVSDYTQAEALIEGFPADYVLADKGHDSDAFVAAINASGAIAVVPPGATGKHREPMTKTYKRAQLS